MTMFSLDDQLVMIIDRLNAAINVCHEAPENEDQGYPYATGYARSAMSDVADDSEFHSKPNAGGEVMIKITCRY